jgi:glycosyltransferase involved in cell wall biosynthesis
MQEPIVITYVEFGSMGHQSIWIRNVVDAFGKLGSDWRLNVWVPQTFLGSHQSPDALCFEPGTLCTPNVFFRSHEELVPASKCDSGALSSRFDVVRRCVEADGSAVCFVALNLGALMRDIALSWPGACSAKLVGVLSHPFLHYVQISSARTRKWLSLRRYVPVLVKSWLMVHRSCVGEVLVLDPLAPGFYNAALMTSKFRYLPDYLDKAKPLPAGRKYFDLPKARRILLFPGNISRRKGILEFLQALQVALRECEDFRYQVSVVIAGLVMPEVRDAIYAAIPRLRSLYPDTPVLLLDRFLTNREFVTLVSVSDVVCMPYREFAGFSGILVHAAAHGRLVLSSDFGLAGELVRQYDLGVVCDETNPQELAAAMSQCVLESDQVNKERQRKMHLFVERYSVSREKFGERVCQSLVRVARGKPLGADDGS